MSVDFARSSTRCGMVQRYLSSLRFPQQDFLRSEKVFEVNWST